MKTNLAGDSLSMKRMRIGHVYEIGIGEERVVNYAGQSVIIKRIEGNEWFAYGKLCPHMGADLSGAQHMDGLIRCPGHGLLFDTKSGECLSKECKPLSIFSVTIDRSEVFLSLKPSEPDIVTTFVLARYGTDGRIGLFEIKDLPTPGYGKTIAVRTPRGVERAEVLPNKTFGAAPKTTGVASLSIQKYLIASSDARLNHSQISQYIETEIRKFDSDLIVLEVETLLCGNLVIHLLGEGKRELGALATRATAEFGREVTFQIAET